MGTCLKNYNYENFLLSQFEIDRKYPLILILAFMPTAHPLLSRLHMSNPLKRIFIAYLGASVAFLAGCSDPSGDGGDQLYVPMTTFTHLEIVRLDSNVGGSLPPSTQIFINLDNGSAIVTYRDNTSTCMPSATVAQQAFNLFNGVRIRKSANTTCPAYIPLNYERFIANDKETLVDGCAYTYAGDGYQRIANIYALYFQSCVGNI